MNISDFIAKNGKAPEAGTEVYVASKYANNYNKAIVVKSTPTGRKVVVKYSGGMEVEFSSSDRWHHVQELDFDIVKVEKRIGLKNIQTKAAEALNLIQIITKDTVRQWSAQGMRDRIKDIEQALQEADKYVMAYEEIEKINQE